MRITVINSRPMVAKVIRLILTDAGHDVVLSHTAHAVLDAIVRQETDAVILDADLPEVDGYLACAKLRAAHYPGPVIFVTPHHDIDHKLRAFQCGADDYVVEPFEPAELLARVEAVARRYRHLDLQAMGSVVKVGDAELTMGELTVRIDGHPPVLLTPTEMRLLEPLMRNPGVTISRETLIERTWGYDYFGDSNRVDVYIARLRKKIEPDPSHPRYLHTVRGSGYAFRAPVPAGHPRLPIAEGLSLNGHLAAGSAS